MTDSVAGLHVIDRSDPTNLRRVGGNGSLGAARVAVDSDMVYVIGQDSGLVVLNSYHLAPDIAPGIRMVDSQLHFSLRADVGQAVRVQRSRDLATWEDWRTFAGTGSFQSLTDVSASGTRMLFYRATTP
ncbi:MAG: hypothetical protein AB9869_19545 [Verrucomicrobiia bacterium]